MGAFSLPINPRTANIGGSKSCGVSPCGTGHAWKLFSQGHLLCKIKVFFGHLFLTYEIFEVTKKNPLLLIPPEAAPQILKRSGRDEKEGGSGYRMNLMSSVVAEREEPSVPTTTSSIDRPAIRSDCQNPVRAGFQKLCIREIGPAMKALHVCRNLFYMASPVLCQS